jgi:predicted TIM-barrel fold metal-dependent hydrolase
MKIAADKGACIGYYCTNFRPLQWSWDEFMQVYQTVGPDRIIAGTDSGIFMSPSPLESMRLYITGMLVRDVPEKDVEKMVKTNASTLLY